MNRYTVEVRVNGAWQQYGIYLDMDLARREGMRIRARLREQDKRRNRETSQMRVRAMK